MSLGPLPQATILIAAYDQAEFLREAVDSALAQDAGEGVCEVLVVNDGSTDGTADILKGYGERIRVLTQKNAGLVAACNAGIAAARGAALGRLDSDDYVAPGWIRRLLGAFEADPHAVCAYGDRVDFFPDGRRHPVTSGDGNLFELVACGSLFRTAELRRVGGFRPLYWEEYDLYLRLKSRGSFRRVPEALYFYRRHPGGMTADPEKRRKGWAELLKTWGPEALRKAGTHPELDAAIREERGS